MKISAAARAASAALLIALPCAAPAAEEPEAVYAKFHRALHAGNLAEMNKYGTPGGAAEIAKLPAEQRKAMLGMMKKFVPQSYTITGKEPSPDGNRMVMRMTGMGTGLLGGKPETQYGTMTLLKQGGEWKVDESNWSNKPPAARAAPAAPAVVPAPAQRPVADQRAPATRPRTAAPAAPAASTALPRLGEAKPPCAYKPVMTDEEIARCR